MGFLSKAKTYVGLDIGSNTVKVVELKPSGKGTFQLLGLAVQPLAPEAIVDGSIMDSSAVIDAIQRGFEAAGSKSADVATSLSGHAVIIKKITLPKMSEAELDESINWEAEQYIPFDIEDVNLDYSILEGESAQGADYMDVLLVAVKKEKLNDYTGVVTQAGKNPVVVDIDTFALQHAYEQNYDPENDKIIALINIGASVMNINIIQEGMSAFWRDISMGGNNFTEAVQRELSLPFEKAERLKLGETVDGIAPERIGSVVQSVCKDVAGEIQKTLDFYRVTSSRDHIDKILLAGGGSKVRTLDRILAESFNCEVEFLNPFNKVQVPSKFTPEQIADAAPSVTIAVGLALRKVG